MDMRSDLYSFEKFRYMCILSGCDYLASLKGIGLKKAQMVFKKTRQDDMTQVG
jgi:exonuclease-1